MTKEQMKQLNIDPLAIAKFFWEEGITSRVVIQKLIYFAFIEGLKNNLIFFTEKFQAWRNGSVLRSVWQLMHNCYYEELGVLFAQIPSLLEEGEGKEVLPLLRKTAHDYKDQDIQDIVKKSHHGPWEKARDGLENWEPSTREIELEDLIKFAKTQITSDYLEKDEVYYRTYEKTAGEEKTKLLKEISEQLRTSHPCKIGQEAKYFSWLGSILLTKYQKLLPYCQKNPEMSMLHDLKERFEKIKNSELIDYNQSLAYSICRELAQENYDIC